MTNHILNKIALVTSGVLIGSGVTYLVVNKRLEQKYSDIAQSEIEEARKHYKLMRKEFPYDDPQVVLDEPVIFNELATGETEVVEGLIQDEGYSLPEVDLTAITTNETVEEFQEKRTSDIMKRAKEHMEQHASMPIPATKSLELDEVTADPSDIPEMITENVFDRKEPSPEDLGKEIQKVFPYLVSSEEWYLTEQQYAKTTLTYYQGSKTLADDKQSILPNMKYLIGEDAVNHFGYDKDNPQTVFVRNDKLKADFEVILDVRTYNEAVFGIDPED